MRWAERRRALDAVLSGKHRTRRHVVPVLKGPLPSPGELAADLAPKVARGDRVVFDLRDAHGIEHDFKYWDWLLELDAEMHRHGAPGWAASVAQPLYRGRVHIEGPYWINSHSTVQEVVSGEVMTIWDGDRLERHAPGNYCGEPSGGRGCPDRWEPGTRHGLGNYRPVSQRERGTECISWRDARHGYFLAEMVLDEMRFEAEAAAPSEGDTQA